MPGLRSVRALVGALARCLVVLAAFGCLSACNSCDSNPVRDCPPCDDLDGPCTSGVCDTSTGECTVEPINEGEACDDEDACTQDDTCQQGVCTGPQIDCSDQEDECNAGGCEGGTCVPVPVEDGTACASKQDDCNDGACQAGQCQAVALEDGTECNDGDWCTVADACLAGACEGAARDCSDEQDCTTDGCDADRNACTHAVQAGHCLIGGQCYADGDPNPDNACQSCLADVAAEQWLDDDSNPCDDGNQCTDPDACVAGVCTGTPLPGCCGQDADCDDQAACTQDTCDVATGLCANVVEAGSCYIGGACFGDGVLNPNNACQVCSAAADQVAWTNTTDPCNDGQFCTGQDVCADGICQGTPGIVCDDGRDCTADTCDEAAATCTNTIDVGACLIGGTCYADGAARPGNSCQACVAATSQSDWSALGDGSPCDDGAYCNDGETCNAGVCEGGGPRDCDDGLACTTDTCDEAAGQCDNALQANRCLIDGACWADGAINPGNPCQECQVAVDPNGWTNDDGNACDDGDWCTVSDACSAGACQGVARDCDDGLGCTTDSCDGAGTQCLHPVDAGACLIGGTCRAAGELNPGNPCQECNPASDPGAWSNDDSNTCDDGNACTDPDSCLAGVCSGTPLPNCCNGPADCADGLDCTDDLCDVGTGTCTNPLLGGWCLIGGVCFADGADDPGNACQACDSGVEPGAFSPKADGSPCDDGQFCTLNDACQAGSCQAGTANDCADGLACTDDVCDEAGDACQNDLLAGRCLIGGTCYTDGQPDPGNDCQACLAATAQDAFSPRPDGVDCGGACQWCQAGACGPVPDTGVDPFVDCPTCQVCDGGGGCRPANDGTDPKDECNAGECTQDNCTAGTCGRSAGTPCTDLSPGNCADAQCDGAGGCDQAHAPEPGGNSVLCRPADDVCDLEEYCDGGSLTCPADLVVAAGTECNPSAGECDQAEACDGISKFCPADGFAPAGTACTDGSPNDCDAAGCDGFGACDQTFAFEPIGTACVDGDACTDPDQCDAIGQCAGAPLYPLPSAGSPFGATSLCLTATSGASTVVWVELEDAGGGAVSGATVEISDDQGDTNWLGPVSESIAQPGTYFRVWQVGANTGAVTFSARAQNGSGPCAQPWVDLGGAVSVQRVAPTPGGTGGCSPVDDNLRVRVVDAQTGLPIPDAYVLVGAAGGSLFEDDYEAVLAGAAPSLLNYATPAGSATFTFTDHGGSLDGPQLVTVGAAGYAYFSLVDVNASDLVIPLEPIVDPPASSQVEGVVTFPLDDPDRNGVLDAALVTTEFAMGSVAKFRFEDMLAEESDCWMATDHWVVGETWVEMPVNIGIPFQEERYLFFWIPVYEHRYTTVRIPEPSTGERVVALTGVAPFGDVVSAIMDGTGLTAVIPLLDTSAIGVYTKSGNGDQNNVSIPASTPLAANVACDMSNIPAYADSLCFTLGDWDGGTGDGSMFVMGFAALSGGSGTVTSVPAAGAFAGIGYLGMGVATYLDSDALPVGEQWRAGATSGRLERSGAAFDGGGGALVFDDFLEVTPLTRTGRSYAWTDVSTATPVDYSEHTIELVQSVSYQPGPDCGTVDEDYWRKTYWTLLAPAGTTGFDLPDLPAGFPRQADGGLVAPAADERLSWSFAAIHLGLLGGFDFNAFDFENALLSVTHTSTNSEDF